MGIKNAKMNQGVSIHRLFNRNFTDVMQHNQDVPKLVTRDNVNNPILLKILLHVENEDVLQTLIQLGLNMHLHLWLFTFSFRGSFSSGKRVVFRKLVQLGVAQGVNLKPFLPDLFKRALVHEDIHLAKACIDAGISFKEVKYIRGAYLAKLAGGQSEPVDIVSYCQDMFSRDRDCKSVLVVLLGISGRWRRYQNGKLRDVFNNVAKMIWFSPLLRRSIQWTNYQIEQYGKTKKQKLPL